MSSVFDVAIEEYLTEARRGATPDRASFLERYPELADDLRAFFALRDRFADGTVAGVPPPGNDEATIAPTRVSRMDVTLQPKAIREEPRDVGPSVRCFGHYELLEEIARGGMGVVYKARQINLNRIVALKMILAGQLAGKQEVQRFHAEAEAAANLDHPGIVPIFEVGEHEGHHYFSMGFIDGVSLAERIKDGPLPTRKAVEYTKQVAEAMAYAHAHGVIHRDLKPANVLLDQSDEPKVTDFGLAKKVEDKEGLTATGEVLGTPSYMPPEQASGKVDAMSESTDVYQLGALLYALLTGHPPFQAASPVDTLLQVLEREPASPRLLNPDLPRDVETISLKCLEKDPQRRYATALDLANELGRFLNNEPIQARPVSSAERVWRWSQRHRAFALMIVATSVLSLVLSVGVIWGYLHERLMRTELSLSLMHEQQLTQRLRKLVEFIHNGEKVRSYERAVEAAASEQELVGALRAVMASSELTALRDQLNEKVGAPETLAEAKAALVDHPDRVALQNWVDARDVEYTDERKAEVFAWFVQGPRGLQLARAPLGVDNVGNNYAWRTYFHGGGEDFLNLDEFLRSSPEMRHLEETKVSTAFKTQTTEEWVVAISTPVFGEDRDEFLGVLGVFLYVTPPDVTP